MEMYKSTEYFYLEIPFKVDRKYLYFSVKKNPKNFKRAN